MAEYDNTNRGVLFRETDKKTDNHPDMTGEVNVEGVEVTKVVRTGSVDWKKVQKAHLADVNVDDYRKPGSEFFKVEVKS